MNEYQRKLEDQRLSAVVINSQFCIRIGEDEIELIYDHSHQQMTVFVNTELSIQYHFSPSRSSFNYVNLMDIAAKMRTHHYKKKLQN